MVINSDLQAFQHKAYPEKVTIIFNTTIILYTFCMSVITFKKSNVYQNAKYTVLHVFLLYVSI